jgi:hypothetical protein
VNKNELIEEIVSKEWKMFDQVENVGGRAGCQNDYQTFHIMRQSQFLAWNESTLKSYLSDLEEAGSCGRNLVSEKYAFMMEHTHPAEYAKISGMLTEVGPEKLADIEKIADIYLAQTESFMKEYPKFLRRTRPVHAEEDSYFTSIETYLKCELKTYSENTVKSYLAYLCGLEKEGRKIVYMIFENMVHRYGYDSLDQAEKNM